MEARELLVRDFLLDVGRLFFPRPYGAVTRRSWVFACGFVAVVNFAYIWAWVKRLARLGLWTLLTAALVHLVKVTRSKYLQSEWRAFLGQIRNPGAVTCPICAETKRGIDWNFSKMSCCGAVVCWACVRRHSEAVIDDARPEMNCPSLNCKQVFPDLVVFSAISREQWSLGSIDVTGRLARRKRRAYDRWVLERGLADLCATRSEAVIHCPRANCDHLWVMSVGERGRKSADEPRGWWNPRSWTIGRYVGLYEAPKDGSRDVRQVHCPKCSVDYCLLCGRQWQEATTGSHAGKSCAEFSSTAERDTANTWAGAKGCPGCGVRIIRSWGCNHMTCTQCGSEWCWICRSSWSPSHYSCTRRTSISASGEVCAIQ